MQWLRCCAAGILDITPKSLDRLVWSQDPAKERRELLSQWGLLQERKHRYTQEVGKFHACYDAILKAIRQCSSSEDFIRSHPGVQVIQESLLQASSKMQARLEACTADAAEQEAANCTTVTAWCAKELAHEEQKNQKTDPSGTNQTNQRTGSAGTNQKNCPSERVGHSLTLPGQKCSSGWDGSCWGCRASDSCRDCPRGPQ